MDTTPQPLAPDLQASLRHLRRIVLGGAVALALLAGAAGFATPAHADRAQTGDVVIIGLTTGKDPELPVSGLTRKVNEYEGQHRLAAADPAPSRPPGGGCGSCH
jgi:hypothetical protein